MIKKMAAWLCIVALALPFCVVAAEGQLVAGVDVSSLSLAELLSLREAVLVALTESDEWTQITLKPGIYEIGYDIPAGYYTISPMPSQSAQVVLGFDVNDSHSKLEATTQVAYEHITHPDDGYFTVNPVPSVSWQLFDGMHLSVAAADVVLTPFLGPDDIGYH